MKVQSDILIIGAGAAGLATAACLKRRGLEATILEASGIPGHSWAADYDALKLHTIRRFSSLPLYPMPRSYPLYPTRDQVVEYLNQYARHFGIMPKTDQRVQWVQPEKGAWLVGTATDTFASRVLVAASGIFDLPVRPQWPGMDTFADSLQHTSTYKNATPFAGKPHGFHPQWRKCRPTEPAGHPHTALGSPGAAAATSSHSSDLQRTAETLSGATPESWYSQITRANPG